MDLTAGGEIGEATPHPGLPTNEPWRTGDDQRRGGGPYGGRCTYALALQDMRFNHRPRLKAKLHDRAGMVRGLGERCNPFDVHFAFR